MANKISRKKNKKRPGLGLKKSKKTSGEKSLRAKEEFLKTTKMRVIGIGGGGSNIVAEIALRIKKPSFVAANTDLQALKNLKKKISVFPFGLNLTSGLGTGMNPELGKEAAQQEKEKIKKLLEGQDFCIFVVSLGGGAGSGAAPVFAKAAKEMGVMSLGVFTLPFKFEGEKKQEIAKEALKKIKPLLNALIVIPNDRIFLSIEKTTPLREALSSINKILAESLEGLIETIYSPGLINIDFADLGAVLRGYSKMAYLNTTEVQGENRAEEAIKKALNCHLFPYSIKGAKKILFNVSGEKELSLADVSQVSRAIFELVNPEAQIIFGISQNPKYKGKIRLCLLATGCPVKIFSEKKKGKTKKKLKGDLREGVKGGKEEKKEGEEKEKPGVKEEKQKQKRELQKAKRKIRVRVKKKKPQAKKKRSKEQNIEEIAKPAFAQNISFGSEQGVTKIRKNALQIKKEIEEAEKEILKEEKIWEIPPFLRRQQNK